MKLIVIGISGITGGGKTTLATALHQYLCDRNNANAFAGIHINQVILIHQDKYFWIRNSPNHTWIREINFINREILSAMDMDKFADDISEMVQQLTGNTLEESKQQCASKIDTNCSRITVNILIIEGFLIYNDERINRFCGLRFHLYLSSDVGFQRRLQRTFKHINPKPKWYWDNYAWPLYQKHLNEVPNKSELILLNGEDDVDCIFSQAHATITKYLKNQIERKC